MLNVETLVALKDLVNTAGPYFVLLLLAGYLIKRLIDSGYELHLKPTRRRDIQQP